VRTANFTLYGDAAESKIKDVGLEMEKLRAVLSDFSGRQARSPVPTSIVVFRDLSELGPFRPLYQGKPRDVGGFFLDGRDGNFIALSAAWNLDARHTIYHEYLHQFMRGNYAAQPAWYDEGLAEFFSTFRATDTDATVGLAVERHISRMREGFLIPLDRLFAVEHDSLEYNEGERRDTFYAESWAVVHYLLRGNLERRAQLGRFLVAIQQGRPRDDAFRESFQTDYVTLEQEIRKYMAGGRFPYTVTKFSELKIPREASSERIDYAQTLSLLGVLLGRTAQERRPAAEAYFRAALAERPDFPGALTGIADIRLREGKTAEALEGLRRAVQAESADYRTFFYYAVALLQEVRGRFRADGGLTPESRKSLEEAREALGRCRRLEASFAEALAVLGRTYFFEEDSRLDEGIDALEQAARLLPARKDVALDLARLVERRSAAVLPPAISSPARP
jgi:tetratricopeptide (TPR) repeat protein